MHLNDYQRKQIYLANALSSGLSLLGSLFIVFMYLRFKDLRGFGFTLILILSLIDIISSISFLIPTYDASSTDISCQIQSILGNFSITAGITWTSIIAYSLYNIIVKFNFQLQNHLPFILGFTIFISISVSVIPFITNSYGTTAGWCWIELDTFGTGFFERLGILVIPFFIATFFNIYLYAKVLKVLKNNDFDDVEQAKNYKSLSKKIGMYPIILVISYLPYFVKQVFELAGYMQSDYEFGLTMAIGILRCLHGLMDFLVYGLTLKVKQKLINFYRRVTLNFKDKGLDLMINKESEYSEFKA